MTEITTRKLNNAIIKGIQEKKPTSITTLDLRKIKNAPAEFMIITQSTSTTHTAAIADSVIRTVKTKLHLTPLSTTGQNNNQWIAIDFAQTFVHIMLPHIHDFFNLEELWADAIQKQIPTNNE